MQLEKGEKLICIKYFNDNPNHNTHIFNLGEIVTITYVGKTIGEGLDKYTIAIPGTDNKYTMAFSTSRNANRCYYIWDWFETLTERRKKIIDSII